MRGSLGPVRGGEESRRGRRFQHGLRPWPRVFEQLADNGINCFVLRYDRGNSSSELLCLLSFIEAYLRGERGVADSLGVPEEYQNSSLNAFRSAFWMDSIALM